jgi:hypothetical protein
MRVSERVVWDVPDAADEGVPEIWNIERALHSPGRAARALAARIARIPCENFLYGFKAARRAARAPDTARMLPLPLDAPAPTAPTPVGWRESMKHPGRY